MRFRKGAKNDKDVFIEVWSAHTSGSGFVSSLKATDKMSKLYNDTVFGGISWSADETKITFIGEVPEIAAYKNPFEEQPKKEEEETKSKAEKPEEHWQDEKYLYTNDFGETLVGKKTPGVFVFNLKDNTLERLQGIPADLYPQRPMFDDKKGLVFSAVKLPLKKLGLSVCLNRPTSLYYIKDPIFDKKKLNSEDAGYMQ